MILEFVFHVGDTIEFKDLAHNNKVFQGKVELVTDYKRVHVKGKGSIPFSQILTPPNTFSVTTKFDWQQQVQTPNGLRTIADSIGVVRKDGVTVTYFFLESSEHMTEEELLQYNTP